ncbi:exonuclease SbcCD subunit D [Deinococcus peraridilitoris]|uniref:Nuclease SbcCD subunit D n=1 Tax=Deinococcus peraridilitoris (strain DSM 19664 / LMG 22246 / CIP 109416 / KR-200) TaxID=937777 RepID=L0A786_DEIPD|nr:exonuclease SbcCD subunit D [Deinococcus peraridilitoris]AFZ68920.1 exonuclease SbcD [Deinococcus peraridilitoris DSM 19664]
MRLLHTADFHAGRTLRGFDRTPEIRAALTEVADLAKSERADAVLVAGDLFDSVNPSAEAESAIYDFFLRLRELEIPSVAIAGNHDSANRLAGLSGLLGWVGVHLVAQMPASPQAAVRTITAKNGTDLVVAAFPFLSERRLVKYADVLGGDVGAWRQKYREGMGFFMGQFERSFRANAVNTLMLHATVEGSAPSGSERTFLFDLTNAYTVSPQQFPTSAQYVALGHVHKPQQPSEAPPAYYPGSLIQLDFGEAGERKGVNLVEVEPGRPAKVHFLPLSAGKPLKVVKSDLDDLDRKLAAVADFPGLLKVVVQVPGGATMPGLKDRVLRLLPQTLAIETEAVGEAAPASVERRDGLTPLQLFERYYRERRGVETLPSNLKAAFEEADRLAREEEVPGAGVNA